MELRVQLLIYKKRDGMRKHTESIKQLEEEVAVMFWSHFQRREKKTPDKEAKMQSIVQKRIDFKRFFIHFFPDLKNTDTL